MIENETEIYKLHKKGDAQYLTFKTFDRYPELTHLFTTRHGGISTGCCESWNLGFIEHRDTMENRIYNCGVLADVLGITTGDMVWSQQTHTTNIRVVTEADRGKGITREQDYTDVDGLVTDRRGIAIVTLHSDCNALYFYDPEKYVIGLAHSGWRGTLGKIGAAMVARMSSEFGCDPGDILAGIGPSLCQDCFEVDKDVADAFFAEDEKWREFAYQRGTKYYLDLWAINRSIFKDSGIRDQHISCMELCTRCNMDMFFSHRGQHGQRGTMAAVMMLK
jgi:YfiH family protein